jgi:hypothetical protein
MIAAVSLRLLYLLFLQVLRLVVLLGGLPVALRVPRTVSQPLISAFMGERPHRHGPQAAQHDRPLWPSDSPT